MKERILQAYQKELSERPGPAPVMTAKDQEAAAMAAKYSEAELRHALVMRAAFERGEWKAARQQAVQA